MRLAYADPPYLGLARRYYGTDEVDHPELIARLVDEFPDGWALSGSADSLRQILPMCPDVARVACWVKGPRPGVSWRPRSAWEPLIVVGGRPRRIDVSEDLSDVLLWGGRQHSHPDALVGMKPAAFCEWMFRQLGAMVGDELVDLFPGSGAITRAWEIYSSPPGAHDGSRPGPRDGSREYSGDRRPTAPSDTSCLAGAQRRLREIPG
jgi:hypothetical protein